MPRTKALAIACGAVALALPAAAVAHDGNPDFRSTVKAIGPGGAGLSAQIVNYDDSVELRAAKGRAVLIRGYDDEPFARITADGTVQVNEVSPAYFLNEERYGAPVPAKADAKAAPRWKTLDRTGRFQWHDHRTHWMAKKRPPQVNDEHKRTRIFNWKVPIAIDGRPAAITGSLFWQGKDDSGPPMAAIGGLAALLLAGGAFVLVVRRRRPDAEAEAW